MTSVLIENIEATRELRDAATSLEFLLLSFCQSFALAPKEAAGLLTQGGKYLAFIVAKGLKGKQQPILSWYDSLLANLRYLVAIIER